ASIWKSPAEDLESFDANRKKERVWHADLNRMDRSVAATRVSQREAAGQVRSKPGLIKLFDLRHASGRSDAVIAAHSLKSILVKQQLAVETALRFKRQETTCSLAVTNVSVTLLNLEPANRAAVVDMKIGLIASDDCLDNIPLSGERRDSQY